MPISPVLTTKLFFPPARQSLIPRPRLVKKVVEGLQGPFLLVSAPAGYGKTTLLSEWRAGVGRDYSAAWLSLDRDDNDFSIFLTYFIAALATLKEGFGETTLALLHSSPPLPDRVILTGLINELGEFDEAFSLILEDYHVIADHSVHDAVAFLLDHLPSQMHLVILTRADPPFPLSRLRARGQMVEIRAADLRLTVEEAAAFLDRVMGLALSREQVEALERRTEGWVASLQLAALSMQGRDDVEKFVSSLTGSHSYIVDYLVEEVLSSQPEPVQEFLLRTSILDQLTSSLCDALTTRSDGQAMVEKLERQNLFLISLDNERRWYRYHHLFAEMLRNRLQQKYPDVLVESHRRAAAWCEQNQFIEQAIGHTFAFEDYDQVVRLLRQNYLLLMDPRNVKTIWHWYKSFPEEFLRKNPWLCMTYAWFLWGRGNRDAAESYIDSSWQSLDNQASTGQLSRDDPEFNAVLAEILNLQGAISASKGDLERTAELANQILVKAPESAYTIRSIAYLNLYLIDRDQGRIDQAIENCVKAIPLAKMGGEKSLVIDAYHSHALMFTTQGQLTRAEGVYREALQYAEKEWQVEYLGCGLLLVHLAEILYEWNDLDEAERMASRALELSEPAYWWVMIYGRAFLSRLQRAKGNLPAAIKLSDEVEALLQQLKGAYFEDELKAYLARSNAELGKLGEAERWARSVTVDLGERLSFPRYVIASQLAYVLSALGREEELLSLLSQVESLSATQGCHGWQIQALVLQATAWQKKANPDRALACLEKALVLAAPEGYMRVFLDEGEPIQLLLADYRSQLEKSNRSNQGDNLDQLKAYITKLLMAFPEPEVVTSKSAISNLQSGLIEPLSERELEILRLVAGGLSNKQIAQTLIIAIGTVKKHLNTIFGKLGVQSRTQCVARARELKLL